MKKFYVIVHDDWELMGSGIGNVAMHQYLPALSLMNIGEKLGIKFTFMVEVAQQLTFNKLQDDHPELKIQKEIWDNTVKLMKEKKFDVQLHLHPQWINSKYENGYFILDDSWNLGTYSFEFQQKILKEGIEYLKSLIYPIDKSYKLRCFKGGAWGLQPSKNLLNNLHSSGIRLVLGVRKNLVIPTLSIDNRNLEETIFPYYPDFNDICRIGSNKNDLIVLPLSYYAPNICQFTKYSIRSILNRNRSKKIIDNYCIAETPSNNLNQDNYHSSINLKFSLHPYETHIKISSESIDYLKTSFDCVLKRLDKLDHTAIPINIECHTKSCIGNFKTIERFFSYVLEKYNTIIEFVTLSKYLQYLEQNPQYVRYNNSDEHPNYSDKHFTN